MGTLRPYGLSIALIDMRPIAADALSLYTFDADVLVSGPCSPMWPMRCFVGSEKPTFIAPDMWPPNSPDIKPTDY